MLNLAGLCFCRRMGKFPIWFDGFVLGIIPIGMILIGIIL